MDRPCKHLAPAVKPLLEAGAIFTEVIRGGDSTRFIHRLSRGPSDSSARLVAARNNLEYWVSRDRHYPADRGLSCNACALAVCWAATDANENAI